MKPSTILETSGHRPWPLPAGPWIMRQTWRDLLFAHWPVRADLLRPLIPDGLALDTFDGSAWISIVPFRMTGVRLRGWPPIPTTYRLPEINVRTYVTAGGQAGVWFLSLDAGSRLAVAVARRGFFLPYFHASIQIERRGDVIHYASYRTHHGAPPAEFVARYAPLGPSEPAAPGTLEDWLTARYCLYSRSHTGQLYRGDVHHAPWRLAPARMELERNTMLAGLGIDVGDVLPLLQAADPVDVVCWPVTRLT